MMTRYLLLLLLIVGLIGCDQADDLQSTIFQTTPETIASDYFDSLLAGNVDEEYKLLSSKDKEFYSLLEYSEQNKLNLEMRKALGEHSKFKVIETETNNDSAIVKLEVTQPDLAYYFGALMKAALATAFSKNENEESQEQMMKNLQSSIEKDGLKVKTTIETITLIKEEDSWRVFKNFEGVKKLEVVTNILENHDNDYTKLLEASEILKEVAPTFSDDAKVSLLNEKVNLALDAAKETYDYLQNIEIYDITAKVYSSLLDGEVPGINFKLKNTGDRIVNEITVVAYFQDKDGNTIHESDYKPVNNNDYCYRNCDPLKPNYIWQQEKGRFFVAKKVPNEWKVGAVKLKVTAVVLEPK